jgi:hypothetical protein
MSNQRLYEAAERARMRLLRVSGEGGILEQIAAGKWDADLSRADVRNLTDMLEVMSEQTRNTRAVAGTLSPTKGQFDGGSGFRDMLNTGLPLNRKERYYTGTVLPMLVASDGFMNLSRFLALCGLDVSPAGNNAFEGSQRLQFFTEYNFAESRFTDHDRSRFPDAPTDGDTPDLILTGDDWLLAVEAKMYHNPNAEALNTQIRRQRVIVDYLIERLGIPSGRVFHLLLLPARFQPGKLNAPVVTWEQVLDQYSVVGPAYWVGVLTEALERYEALVSRGPPFGMHADGKMTGAEIVAAHADGTLEFTYMGRKDGIDGELIKNDVATGQWRTQQYEVRYQALKAKNWFPVSEFIAITSRS